MFKFAAKIIGGSYAYLRGFTGRKSPQKKRDSWPLRDTLHVPEDDAEPQPMYRNHQGKGDSWPLRDTLHFPDDDPKPKPNLVKKIQLHLKTLMLIFSHLYLKNLLKIFTPFLSELLEAQ